MADWIDAYHDILELWGVVGDDEIFIRKRVREEAWFRAFFAEESKKGVRRSVATSKVTRTTKKGRRRG